VRARDVDANVARGRGVAGPARFALLTGEGVHPASRTYVRAREKRAWHSALTCPGPTSFEPLTGEPGATRSLAIARVCAYARVRPAGRCPAPFVLWRFEGDKIAERWATVTPPAEDSSWE
jgi:hypothetical protein